MCIELPFYTLEQAAVLQTLPNGSGPFPQMYQSLKALHCIQATATPITHTQPHLEQAAVLQILEDGSGRPHDAGMRVHLLPASVGLNAANAARIGAEQPTSRQHRWAGLECRDPSSSTGTDTPHSQATGMISKQYHRLFELMPGPQTGHGCR